MFVLPCPLKHDKNDESSKKAQSQDGRLLKIQSTIQFLKGFEMMVYMAQQ
jgi:hypothetical protein